MPAAACQGAAFECAAGIWMLPSQHTLSALFLLSQLSVTGGDVEQGERLVAMALLATPAAAVHPYVLAMAHANAAVMESRARGGAPAAVRPPAPPAAPPAGTTMAEHAAAVGRALGWLLCLTMSSDLAAVPADAGAEAEVISYARSICAARQGLAAAADFCDFVEQLPPIFLELPLRFLFAARAGPGQAARALVYARILAASICTRHGGTNGRGVIALARRLLPVLRQGGELAAADKLAAVISAARLIGDGIAEWELAVCAEPLY